MSPTPAHSVTDQFARTPTGGAGMLDRHTANTITDDALDALYTELERLREQQAGFFAQMAAARQQVCHWWQRAQAAERKVEQAQIEGAVIEFDVYTDASEHADGQRAAVRRIRAALEGQQQETAQ